MYMPSDTGIAQGGVLSPLLMNIALHGMEAVVTDGSAHDSHARHGRELPLLVRYADDFVIVHSDVMELQQAVLRIRQWLATMGLQLRADKTRLTHTLTPYRGQVGFDFLGFNICQEQQGKQPTGNSTQGASWSPLHKAPLRRPAAQKLSSEIKTIVRPASEASERHLTVIEQRLQQLHGAPQARVIEALNPLIVGWASYYNGLVPAATMGYYDEWLEQRLLHWASQRHPGKAREWLRARYWRSAGEQGRQRSVFATQDGIRLRPYRPLNIL